MKSKNKAVVGLCLLAIVAASGFFAYHYLDQEHWAALVQGLVQIAAGSLQ
jgi:hypothetical protein